MCVFLATFSSWAIPKARDARKWVHIKTVFIIYSYPFLKPLITWTDWIVLVLRQDGAKWWRAQTLCRRVKWGHTFSLTRSLTVDKCMSRSLSPMCKIRLEVVVTSQGIVKRWAQYSNISYYYWCYCWERMTGNMVSFSTVKKGSSGFIFHNTGVHSVELAYKWVSLS